MGLMFSSPRTRPCFVFAGLPFDAGREVKQVPLNDLVNHVHVHVCSCA